MFSRPKILFLVSLLFVALLNSIPTYLLNFKLPMRGLASDAGIIKYFCSILNIIEHNYAYCILYSFCENGSVDRLDTNIKQNFVYVDTNFSISTKFL